MARTLAPSRPSPAAIEHAMTGTLPEPFAAWFAAPGLDAAARTSLRCWRPRSAGESVLLIAPTGGGKTLAGLPAHAGGAGRGAACRPPYAVCQPAEGAGDRHRAQPDAPGGGDAARGVDRDPHRRHAGQPPRAPAGRSAEHPADHAGKPGGAAVAAGCAGDVRRPRQRGDGRGARARRHQARRPVGAVRRAADDAGAVVPPRRAVGDGGASGRDPRLCRRRQGDRGAGRRAARTHHDAAGGRTVLGRPHGPGCRAWRDGAHPRGRHDDRVRQHARPGGADVPGAVAAERADAADRAASRLAGGGAAPPRRGGDGGRQAARRGGDLVARSRHRLGRGGPGDPGRRAEGRVAAAAARGARQSPDGRSIARHPGAGQPLRGAGMRGGHARRRRARAGRRSAAAGRAGRAGAASAWAGLCRAVPPGRCVRRGAARGAVRGAVAQGLRRRAGLRGERRLRARRRTNAGASCSATARAACMCAASASRASTA